MGVHATTEPYYVVSTLGLQGFGNSHVSYRQPFWEARRTWILHQGSSSDHLHIGGSQNYGPLLGAPNTRCHTLIRTQKGTIILTTTHIMNLYLYLHLYLYPLLDSNRKNVHPQKKALLSMLPKSSSRSGTGIKDLESQAA